MFLKVATTASLVLGLAACASEPAPPPAPVFTAETSYCYVSLADVECYRTALPGESYRLVGTRPTAD